jgi:hypothetical protein
MGILTRLVVAFIFARLSTTAMCIFTSISLLICPAFYQFPGVSEQHSLVKCKNVQYAPQYRLNPDLSSQTGKCQRRIRQDYTPARLWLKVMEPMITLKL